MPRRFVPPGHFYSPIPSIDDIRGDRATIPRPGAKEIPGIDLREADQLRLLDELLPFYSTMPFRAKKSPGLRYYFDNPAYSYSDAIFLHCMIRRLRPARIIEVGSGFSSCVTLDTNARCFDGAIATTFIEPHAGLLRSMLDGAERNIRILPVPLQRVDLAEFEALAANDILFVDSSHVSKVNSDVNRIFFDILPRLAPGVHVHFHDIFYPFEYPEQWLLEGRAWNEAYVLRAFLQFNRAFEIVLMNTFMETFHEAFFQAFMPLCLENRGGSIWLRRAAA